MAQSNHLEFGNQLDIEQILFEAQHRWLRTPEICEILQNYKRFNIAPEPPNLPPSGALFLFDKKVLRYFRKDGHSWKKKKDGKTVKEAHERLKAGSIDVLHCYYAHGEDNENFQRRSYWMLKEELSHIVLVHYREVKGYRTAFNRFKETEEDIANTQNKQIICNSEAESSLNSGLQQNCCPMLSQNNDSRSPQASNYEDAESGNQAKSTTVSSLEIDVDRPVQKHQNEPWGWENVLENHNVRVQFASLESSILNVQSDSVHTNSKQENVITKLLLTDPCCETQASRDLAQGSEEWQAMHAMDYQTEPSALACKEDQVDVVSNLTGVKNSSHFSSARTLLDRPVKDETLPKIDSFSQWMCKELEDVEPVKPSSGAYWDADDKRSDCPNLPPQDEFDSYTIGPSLSQDQHFKIIDFAPNWGYAGSETKVLITGKFMKTRLGAENCQWSCMFGEVEVPAEVIADGALRCHAPPHCVGRVPFYVTCSNRLACSEVREFEYQDKFMHAVDATSLIQIKFCKLLSLGSSYRQNIVPCNGDGNSDLDHEITSLQKGNDNEWFHILELSSKEEFSLGELKDRLAEKIIKERFCEWLLCKRTEGGKGPRVLDENGQGVLHFAAALGYDWAISLTVAAGISINFRDVRGWTALHWAAYYGRERTVVYLISLGASAGALTDPSPTYPMGRTPADLASENGHKGISGFLAESALSAHLECLTLKDKFKQDSTVEVLGMTSVLTATERTATPISKGVNLDGLSLKDSLAAVCNASQAAARIHQVFRSHSFKRNRRREFGNDKKETPDEYALSAVTLNSPKRGQHDEPVHAAAVRIQNKFRSWKGRREFITLRKKIVKIQAHVRGHQVRKHYKAFVWSVGIVEKVILRWRRKKSGLRGFKSESLPVTKPQSEGKSFEDDYDFFKEGRKQTEQRLQKALSRVKSMVRYPEARDQYRRLLTAVSEIKDMKDGCSNAIDGAYAATSMGDDLVDLDRLLNDGTTP
ncbi:calmodulin-binding transcription activator 3-like isoform X1 [Chenopodium quinoa]|uniref:CG-1 domain-containing protein n=2 Tax=Chenopodium quinoa TaxID=63459 RepID=A0A803KXP1_CHEQI|nr:calmodulin-binding transcription activator 3-like isoform X1 [Chenopodium quinoa]